MPPPPLSPLLSTPVVVGEGAAAASGWARVVFQSPDCRVSLHQNSLGVTHPRMLQTVHHGVFAQGASHRGYLYLS